MVLTTLLEYEDIGAKMFALEDQAVIFFSPVWFSMECKYCVAPVLVYKP